MWTRSSNGESVKPAETEYCDGIVIVRRNFERVETTDEMPEHWSYLEWQMTNEQYEVYKVMKAEFELQEDAILEIADMLGSIT